MNNDEAKFILSGFRPGGEDAGDAKFAEALAQADRDPELAQWFEEERRFDSAMSDALSAVPIPRNLRTDILAGGKISRPHFWQARRTLLALAAGIVLLAAVAGIWMHGQSRLERWQQDALAVVPTIITGETRFDFQSKNAAVLQRWLQTQNAPAPAAIPAALKTLPALGCKIINSGGRPVSIICFRLHSNELIHLVLTEQGNPSLPPQVRPRFVEENGWKTASWSANGRAYMLATKASETELHAFLATTAQADLKQPRKI